MGTEILRRGIPTTLPLWSAEALLTRPEVVRSIHEDYIRAGAEIIITDTFRTTRWAFASVGMAEKAREASLLACRLARQAIQETQPDHPVYIAGSIAPLEDCYSPELTPAQDDLLREHFSNALDLKEGGVDFLLLETMITSRETMAAVRAAQSLGLPFAASFCTDAEGRLLGGELLEDIVREVEAYDPLFIGVNCVSPDIATRTLLRLKTITRKPLSVYAQGDGIPEINQGWLFVEEDYAAHVAQWRQAGAQIIGGCCGTSPPYIARLRDILSESSF